MKRDKWQYIRMVFALAICLLMGAMGKMQVLAGDINAEEQRVIAYYNRVFIYEGKQYTATEAAKQEAYNRMAADGVDLSAAEVDSLILQASKNVAQGIQQGYLIEVTDEKEDTSNQDEEKEEVSQEETNQNENEEKNENEESKTDKKSEQISKDSQKESEDKKKSKRKKANVKEIIIEAEKEGENYGIVNEQKDGPITIEQYISGKITAVSEDGTVWYQSTLPIKNTGYADENVWIVPAILLIGTMLTAFIGWKIRKKNILWAVVVLGIVITTTGAIGIGGKELGNKVIGEWKSIWVLGAPKYQYEEKMQLEEPKEADRPLLGTQYGQLRCERLEYSAPIYYGDSQDILEKGIGTYSQGALPWQDGTMLASGHDTTYFAQLEDIEKGDVFLLDTIYGEYRYKVTKTKVADVLDTEAYELKESGKEMILYTCYPFGETEQMRNQRFFVYAKRINKTEGEK